MLSIHQLMSVATKDEVLETLLSQLTALRFNARSWHVGGARRTLLEVFAQLYASATSVNADLARAGFNDTAKGPWLDIFSLSHYANKREDAVATEGFLRLTAAANAPGPFTLGAESLVFTDRELGLSYRNMEGATLLAGETLDLPVRCETPGAIGDVAPGTVTIMRTPLAGVTVTNPSGWITRNGSDVESDPSLQEKNRTKWATLAATTRPGNAYVYFAKEAHASVRRVNVDTFNPRGPGTINVWLAGDAGPLGQPVVDTVQQYMLGQIDNVERIGLGADVQFKSAVRYELPLRGRVLIRSSYNTRATQLSIVAAIRELFRTLPVGGVRDSLLSADGRIPLGEVFRVVMATPGVQNLQMVSPTEDVRLEARQVAVPAVLFAYVSV